MRKLSLEDHPHRRKNQLTGEWVFISPHRAKRPWQGQVEKFPEEKLEYDPNCYLCPNNERAGGKRNPDYESTYVFTNDFAAVLPDTPSDRLNDEFLLEAESVIGTSRVVCFSPRHDLTLPQFSLRAIIQVIDLWIGQYKELDQLYKWVQIFENKGQVMGCSNPHPHGQIWATNTLPNEPNKEDGQQNSYFQHHNSTLLLDYLFIEQRQQKRIVLENEHWSIVVPFWAVWPFETLLIPRRHILRLTDLRKEERISLAEIMKNLLIRYDNLFETEFPYSMGWHSAPNIIMSPGDEKMDLGEIYNHWQLHAHFYPPLLRSASVKKFMVGYEMLAEAQRDLTPETAAQRIGSQSGIHYKEILPR